MIEYLNAMKIGYGALIFLVMLLIWAGGMVAIACLPSDEPQEAKQ